MKIASRVSNKFRKEQSECVNLHIRDSFTPHREGTFRQRRWFFVGFSTTASGLAELCNKAPLEMGGCAKRGNALSIGGVI
jgi:hypothetical protein